MTVRERHDLAQGFELERMNVGPEDQRKAQLIAGSAVARLDNKTAVAFGFADGAKAMERRLTGASQGAFLVANDIAGKPGLPRRAQQQHGDPPRVRRHGRHRSGEKRATSGRRCKTQRDRLALSLATRRGRPPFRPQLAAGRHQPSRRAADAPRRPDEQCARRRRSEHLVPRRRGAARIRQWLERDAGRAARLDRLWRRQVPDRRLLASTSRSTGSSADSDTLASGSRSRCGSSMAASR